VKQSPSVPSLVRTLLCAWPVLFPGVLAAQIQAGDPAGDPPQLQRITLTQALSLSGASPELRIARATAADAEGLAGQARAYPNPTLHASFETLDQPDVRAEERYLTLSQRIEWPSVRGARISAAEERAVAAQFRVSADSVWWAYQVKRAYVHAGRVEREVEVLRRVMAVFRQGVETAEARYAEGDVSLYDLSRLGVERNRYEAMLAGALLELRGARHELARLVSPDAPELQLAPSDPPQGMPPVVDASELEPHSLALRPEIAVFEAEARSAKADLSGVRARRVPEVTANAGFMRQHDGFSGVFLALSLPLPLWDRSGGALEAGSARTIMADAALERARRDVLHDARRALDEYRSYQALGELLNSSGPASDLDLLEVAQVAYDEGEVELIALLDAAAAYLEAESAALRIQSGAWIRYYDLERAVGGFEGTIPEEDGP